jgi:hypothetical protein
MSLDLEAIKKTFFDAAEIQAAADKGTIKALSKQGAFVRRKQKSLVRYRKKVSLPGEPPSAHRSERFTRTKTNKKGETKTQSQSPFRELIFFGYDAATKSVVEGPAAFLKAKATGKTTPEVLEEGGQVVLREPVKKAATGKPASEKQKATFRRLIAEGRIQGSAREFAKRSFHVKARPSAKPALDAELPKFADCFKNQFKGQR